MYDSFFQSELYVWCFKVYKTFCQDNIQSDIKVIFWLQDSDYRSVVNKMCYQRKLWVLFALPQNLFQSDFLRWISERQLFPYIYSFEKLPSGCIYWKKCKTHLHQYMKRLARVDICSSDLSIFTNFHQCLLHRTFSSLFWILPLILTLQQECSSQWYLFRGPGSHVQPFLWEVLVVLSEACCLSPN